MDDKTKQEYFEIPEEVSTLRKQNELYAVANDQVTKDYQTVKQELVYANAKNDEWARKYGDLQKQFNDMLIYTRDKVEQVKNIVIEVPQKTLYSLVCDWQKPSESVFVTVNEDGEVNLRTREEIDRPEDWKPVYRHWWLVNTV